MPLPAPDFDRLLVPGLRLSASRGPDMVVGEPLSASISLPSGRVVASAWGWDADLAYTEAAPPGRYPVLLYPVRFDGIDQDVSAAVKIVVRDEPVTEWRMALWPGTKPADIEGDEAYCYYPVDGGEASLIDAQLLRELWDGGRFQDYVDDSQVDLGFGGLLEEYEDPETGHTAVVFTTGGGDGRYPTWIGHNAAGDITCFVTEFFVLGSPE